jgi:hypothetical protein
MELLKHIQKLKEEIDSKYNQLGDILLGYERVQEQLKEKCMDLSEEAYSRTYSENVDKFKQDVAAVQEEYQTVLQEVRAAYMKEVGDYYRPDGNRIDQADQAVISAGILNADEVSEMAIKHCDNPTMLRIIQRYVNDAHVKLTDHEIEMIFIRVNWNGKEEKRIFNRFVSIAGAGFGHIAAGGSENIFMMIHERLDTYERDAEKALLVAKLYHDQETKDRINEITEQERKEHNDAREGKDFLH